MYETIIVAVDFGTQKITAVAAKKNMRGVLTVLSVETVSSSGSILRGRIYNQEEVVYKLNHLLSILRKKHEIEIEKIYVGIGGQSVHAIPFAITRHLEAGESEVTQKLLDSMMEECLNAEPEGWAVVGAVSPEYKADGRLESNPKGVECKTIEAKYQLLVGRPSLERNLLDVAKKAGVSVAGIIPSVEAVSEAVLTATEKDLGCTLIDFGAGTTSVAVCKNRLLQYYTTLPVGSEAITKDLASDNMTLEEAEEFKKSQGTALPADDDTKNRIIEARVDEILTNVVVLMKRAGVDVSFAEGVVITGGGALLKNMAEAVQESLKCKVRIANPKDSLFIQEIVMNASPEYALVTGLLSLGKENCATVIEKPEPVREEKDLFGNVSVQEEKPKEEKPKKTEEPKPNKGGLFGRLKAQVGKGIDGVSKGLFDDEN